MRIEVLGSSAGGVLLNLIIIVITVEAVIEGKTTIKEEHKVL